MSWHLKPILDYLQAMHELTIKSQGSFPHKLQTCKPACINFVITIVIVGCQSLENSLCMYAYNNNKNT